MAFSVGAAVATIKADLTNFKQGIGEAKSELDSFKDRASKGADVVISGLERIVVGGLAVGAAFTAFGIKAGFSAARVDELTLALHAIAKANGIATSEADNAVASLRKNNIAQTEALQITSNFITANLKLTDAIKLSTAAKDLGIIANVGSSQATEMLTQAIVTGQTQQLAQFGILTTQTEAYDNYAASIGKSASEMTQADKQQALLNVVLAQGEKVVGVYDASMQSVSKQFRSLTSRVLPDFIAQIGTAFSPAITVVIDAFSTKISEMSAWIKENKDTIKQWGDDLASAATQLVDLSGKAIDSIQWMIQHKDLMTTIAGVITLIFLPALIKLAVEGFIANTVAIAAFVVQGWQAVFMLMTKTFQLGLTAAAFVVEAIATDGATIATAAMTAATWLLNAALAVLTSPVFLVVAAIVALIAIGWLLIANWDKVKAFGKAMLDFLVTEFNKLPGWIKSAVSGLADILIQPFRDAWNAIKDLADKIRGAANPNQRHSPSMVDLVKTGVSDLNRAWSKLAMPVPTINHAPQLINQGGSTGAINTIALHINMDGAIIADDFSAQRISEKIGDAIVGKLQKNLRF